MTRLTLSEAAAADLWSIPKRPSFGTGRGPYREGSQANALDPPNT